MYKEHPQSGAIKLLRSLNLVKMISSIDSKRKFVGVLGLDLSPESSHGS